MPMMTRDGVRLAFQLHRGHRPPVVLIHGFCCDSSFMAAQFAHFAARGYSVLAPDLRGHGRSDTPDHGYSFEGLGDDILWMCARLGLQQPAFIGHSMGGTVAYDIAVRFPELPRAVALLDSGIVLTPAARAAFDVLARDLRGPHGADAMVRMADEVFFLPTDGAERRRHILEVMGQASPGLLAAGADILRGYDAATARGRLSAPLLYIAANEPTPRADLAALAQIVPHAQVARTVGSGHFCQMEVPEQVNAMLDRFLALAGHDREGA
ncbi:alpha/beta fold hydrolase [Xanthobacter sediminis]